jgi:5-oxoprolinase (ATP-hydrolysing)
VKRRYRLMSSASQTPKSWSGAIVGVPVILVDIPAVILREFGLRPDSGGVGAHHGGNGVIRDIEFLESMQVSLLTERRSRAPYGMSGGGEGKTGVNTWLKQTHGVVKRKVNLGGKASVRVAAGDRLVLHTPGGGGWGVGDRRNVVQTDKVAKPGHVWEPRGSLAEKASAEAAFGA